MKFLSFLDREESRLGLLKDDGKVVDLSALLAACPDHGLPFVPADVGELIGLGTAALDAVETCLRRADAADASAPPRQASMASRAAPPNSISSPTSAGTDGRPWPARAASNAERSTTLPSSFNRPSLDRP